MGPMQIKKIIRSKRKTITLQVCDDATLIVKAPFKTGDNIIKQVINNHHKWLENKKKEILSRDIKYFKKKFVNGEGFLYLGQTYRLKLVNAHQPRESLALNDGYFYLQENVIDRRDAFLVWYKKKAYENISERVRWYAQKRGFRYHQVKISNAQKQWGSCTHLSNLNFSWRLVMAVPAVIDYVVVHELVHLIEKNHSRSFWNKVQLIIPDYEKHRNWLKKNGYLLNL